MDNYTNQLEKCIIAMDDENAELKKRIQLLEKENEVNNHKCYEKVLRTKQDLRTAVRIIEYGKKSLSKEREEKKKYQETIEDYESELIRVNSLLVCNELMKDEYEGKLTTKVDSNEHLTDSDKDLLGDGNNNKDCFRKCLLPTTKQIYDDDEKPSRGLLNIDDTTMDDCSNNSSDEKENYWFQQKFLSPSKCFGGDDGGCESSTDKHDAAVVQNSSADDHFSDSDFDYDEQIIQSAMTEAKKEIDGENNGELEDERKDSKSQNITKSTVVIDKSYIEGCLKEMKALEDFNDLVYLLDSKGKQSVLINQSNCFYVAPRVQLPSIDWLIQKRELINKQQTNKPETTASESAILLEKQDGITEAENLDAELYGTWIDVSFTKQRSLY